MLMYPMPYDFSKAKLNRHYFMASCTCVSMSNLHFFHDSFSNYEYFSPCADCYVEAMDDEAIAVLDDINADMQGMLEEAQESQEESTHGKMSDAGTAIGVQLSFQA